MSNLAGVGLPRIALSLIQPWAWAVLHAGKDVENRVWWSTIREEFWIAASAQVTRRYYDSSRECIERIAPGIRVPRIDELPRGGIVGRARIVDCILPGGFAATNDRQARDARLNHALGGQRCLPPRHSLHPHRWHFPDQYGYVLADRLPVPFVPCKGHQRWWRVPESLLEQLAENYHAQSHC